MWSKSLWLVCLWFASSTVKSQESLENCTVDENELPEVQSGINNFIIDELGTLRFPYALNQCTENNVISTGRWYWYQCSMDNNGMSTVTKTEYFTSDCSGSGSVVTMFNESDMIPGEVGHFECSGTDSYAKIRLSLDSLCITSVVVYAALGACSNMIDNSQMNFFCSADEAIGQIFTLGQLSTTFLPSSTQVLFNTTNVPSGINQTLFPTELNNTLLPTQFNVTNLPTLFNQTILPTAINVTILPTEFNATLPTVMVNVTMPSIINISTSQIEMLMCEDETFCDKWIISRQCKFITRLSFGIDQGVYAIFDECSEAGMVTSSTTMLPELNTTFGENVTVTEPSIISTIISTVVGTESSAVRPSLLFTVGMILSFFFLVSV